MTPAPDTSSEAVDAMCERLEKFAESFDGWDGNPDRARFLREAAIMLSAVADERDHWRMFESIPHRRLEAAEAEAAALREALREIEALEIDWRLSTAENMRAASDIARAAIAANREG